jgi:hypothetical protein
MVTFGWTLEAPCLNKGGGDVYAHVAHVSTQLTPTPRSDGRHRVGRICLCGASINLVAGMWQE